MKSKCWMVEKLAEIFPLSRNYCTLWWLVCNCGKKYIQQFGVKKYYNIELDENCIEIADDFNYEQYQNNWQFKSVQQDCGTIKYSDKGTFDLAVKNKQKHAVSVTVKPDLVINTSCEHMNEDWYNNLPDGMLVCLQTNDYFSNEQHVNCVNGVQAVASQHSMKEVLYEGEIDTHLYNRFMLIGENNGTQTPS